MKSTSRGTGWNRWLWPICIVLLPSALSACGGNIEPAGVSGPIDIDPMTRSSRPDAEDAYRRATKAVVASHVAAALQTRPHGTLLDGLPGTYAHQALRGYVEEQSLDTAVSQDQTTSDRLQLSAVIAATATVGQVNAALNQVRARIVSMQPDNSEVRLDLEAPGGTPSKHDVALKLMASRAFEAIDGVRTTALPAPLIQPAPVVDPYAPAPVDDHQSPP